MVERMLMKKSLFFILLICSVTTKGQDVNSDYQSFRKGLLDSFQSYRKTVYDNYSDYLAGIWEEFQLFHGTKRDGTPKPNIVPTKKNTTLNSVPALLPSPDIIPDKDRYELERKPEVKPIISNKPITAQMIDFAFYGIKLSGIKADVYHVSSLEPTDISKVWKKYKTSNTDEIVKSLFSISQLYGLNDWFTFELVRCYVDDVLKNGSSSDRIVLQHFILARLGFDIRLASTKRQLVLLVPFAQQVYEKSFLKIDEKKYYVFYDNLSCIKENSISIYTCCLPNDLDKGQCIDLSFKHQSLKLKYGTDKNYTLSDGKIKICGKINSGVVEMLRHYPLTDVPCYACSKILPSFHKEILEQIRPQIIGMSTKQAANALLHFVQYSFGYASDIEQHGYEKPYFVEENFFYPKNDCEDRSIFYAFLVHNLLGLDVHLVRYPGHECTAVNFNNQSVDGDGYIYKGNMFVICDPTYIGASIGQCMPEYHTVQPIIEKWY